MDGLRTDDVQRIVLAGPGTRAGQVTHALLEVTDDSQGAKDLLARMLERQPGDPWRLSCSDLSQELIDGKRSDISTSLGLTAHGLAALGVAGNELATFPLEFKQGPHPRCAFLGDVGANDPQHWLEPFQPSFLSRLHIVLSIWEPEGGSMGGKMLRELGGEASPLRVLRPLEGRRRGEHREPFGFVDGGKRQPWIPGVRPDDLRQPPGEAVALGEFVLGHATQFGDEIRRWRVPGLDARPEERLGFNGSFAALRVMRQDVARFKEWTQINGTRAAQRLCGITFDGEALGDEKESLSIIGSHVGRANPQQRLVSRGHHRRRLIRRGMPYHWPEFGEHGLLGLFICANLAAQYEGVLGEWLNNAVHDPRIAGTNDPLVGFQGLKSAIPQFVFTRGVSYLFMPGRAGLEKIVG